MYKYSIFKTNYGYMGAVASPLGLHLIILPKKDEKEVKQVLEAHYATEIYRDEKLLSAMVKIIKSYLTGNPVIFKEKLDVSGATPFEIKVWDTVNGIPRGEVRSYAWVAAKVGKASEVRAVGQALKRNRWPIIIPCHRVIRKSGDLGGYAGGAQLKYKLLKLEGSVL